MFSLLCAVFAWAGNLVSKFQECFEASRRLNKRVRPTLESLEGRTVPSTFTVTSTSDTTITPYPRGTLRWAVDQAVSHDTGTSTIDFNLSSYPATISLAGNLNFGSSAINRTINVAGPSSDPSDVTIDGGGSYSLSSGATGDNLDISGLTVNNGYATTGGGFYVNGGSLDLANCVIQNSTAGTGGGIFVDFTGNNLTLESHTITPAAMIRTNESVFRLENQALAA